MHTMQARTLFLTFVIQI